MQIFNTASAYVVGASLAILPITGCSSSVTQATHPETAISQPAKNHSTTIESSFIGQEAPSFSLTDDQGTTVQSSDLRGRWVVLYFYPQDGTPDCVVEATAFTSLLSEFRLLNAAIIGISPDSPASHREFRKRFNLTISLLSDQDHQVMKQFGAWRESIWRGAPVGRVVRTTFLVDPMGRIAWHWPQVIAENHAVEVREKLEALKRQ